MKNNRYEKQCPICGKRFVPCGTDLSAFNWRRVACSPECGKEYFRAVLEARGEIVVVNELDEQNVALEETEVKIETEDSQPVRRSKKKAITSDH